MKSILDPTFHYVPSVQTDIRKTFDRVRREMKRAAERQMPVPISNVEFVSPNIFPIRLVK